MPLQLCKVLLHAGWIVFLWFCISIICDFGECCESVPLDRSGSYISISIKTNVYIYITRILARVVQVDASLLQIFKLVTSAL